MKVFFKFFRIYLLSYCLLIVGFAESSNPNSNFISKDTVTKDYKTQSGTEKLDSAKQSDYMGTLLMTGVGLVASRLYTCKMTTDMMIAAGAAGAYILGDLLETFKMSGVMKDLNVQYNITNDEKNDLKQIEALEKLKKSYEEALKTANQKIMLQGVAALGFAAAAVAAGALYMSEQSALAACNGALATAGATCAAAFSASCSGMGATCVYPLQTGGLQALATVAPISMQAITALTPAMSTAKMATDKSLEATNRSALTSACSQCPGACGASGACQQIFTLNLSTKGYCPAPLSISKNDQFLKSFNNDSLKISKNLKSNSLENFIQTLLFNKAHADLFSPLGIMSSLAITFVLATSKTLGMQIDMMLFSPMNRAITWGVLGAITAIAITSSSNQAKIIKENISKIDKILQVLYGLKNGNKASNVGLIANGPINAIKVPTNSVLEIKKNYTDIDLNGNKILNSTPCLTGKDTANCPSFSSSVLNRPDLKNLPNSVQNQIGDFSKFVDGINGTSKISASTMELGDTLGKGMSAINTELQKQKKAISDHLSKTGSKINLEKEENKFKDSLNKAIQSELDKNKMSAKDMSIALKKSENSNSIAEKNKSQTEDANYKNNLNNENKNSLSNFDQDKIGFSGSLEGSSNKNRETSSVKENENSLPKDEIGSNLELANSNSVDNYESRNDITKDEKVSLFDVITIRYKKSGYVRLFKKKVEL